MRPIFRISGKIRPSFLPDFRQSRGYLAQLHHGPVDHEFTDWAALDVFVDSLLKSAAS